MIITIAGLVISSTPPALYSSQAHGSSREGTLPGPAPGNSANGTATTRARAAYGELPMRFESNQGQFDAQVKYAARGAGYSLWLTGDQTLIALSADAQNTPTTAWQDQKLQRKQPSKPGETGTAVIRMTLVNATRAASVSGENELPGRSNYFIGNDPTRWRAGVISYSHVIYKNVYRGVDLVYYGNGHELEYDFKVAPGANPAAIAIQLEGASRLRLDQKGELVIGAGEQEFRQRKLVAYQESAGKRIKVSARYVLSGKNKVSFALGRYDHRKSLVIDPVLAYSTYLGGTNNESINAIAIDSWGNAYLTGSTSSSNFPVVNPIGSFNNFGTYAFVSKLNSMGSALIYSSYISGNPNENASSSTGLGITMDVAGNVYVTGQTNGFNFPTTPGAFQSTNHGYTDAFALKLNDSGSALIYSTFLGGLYEDSGKGIAVDAGGSAYVTGQTVSVDFPMANAMQAMMSGYQDAFVTKLNSTGTSLVYSTYLGGREKESGNGIAVDSSGNAYVAGGTSSDDFPTANAFQPSFRGRGAFQSTDGAANWAAVSNSFPFTTAASAVVVDPKNSSTLYIGTYDRGPYKSTDGGVSWFAIHNGIADLTSLGFPGFYNPINDLEIDRNTPTTLFAAVYGNGVLKSTDSGNTWTQKAGFLATSVKINPANSANVYHTDFTYGFYHSEDGGETWDQYFQISPTNQIQTCAVAPTNPTTVYAGTIQGGLFRLGGNGGSQSLIGNPIHAIAVDPTNPAIVYVAATTGMFKSTNSGDSWTQINNGLVFNGITSPMVSLAIDPQTPNTIYAGSTGLFFKSTNGGATWVQQAGLPTAYMFDIAIDNNATSHLYVALNIVDDAFVSKVNNAGSALIYSTYIGGQDIDDALGIALDSARNAYVCGTSYSTSIDEIVSAFPRRGRSDAFAMKLSSAGALNYFSYIGGSGGEQGKSIAIDSADNSYVVGNTSSSDLPTTAGAIPVAGGSCTNCTHAFVTKLNQQGTTILYSSYLGGNPDPPSVSAFRENGNAIAIDRYSGIYVVGQAFSTNFPVTPGAFDMTQSGSGDGFVTKLEPFDFCIQDDLVQGNVVLVNAQTGDYRFCCGGVQIASGRGTLTIKGSSGAIDQVKGVRSVHIQWDMSANKNEGAGSAIVQSSSNRTACQITDSRLSGNSCVCQ
jgi:hypothetical protein